MRFSPCIRNSLLPCLKFKAVKWSKQRETCNLPLFIWYFYTETCWCSSCLMLCSFSIDHTWEGVQICLIIFMLTFKILLRTDSTPVWHLCAIIQKDETQFLSLKCWMRHTQLHKGKVCRLKRGGCLVQMSHNGVLLMKSSLWRTMVIPAPCLCELAVPDTPLSSSEPSFRWESVGVVPFVMTCCFLSNYSSSAEIDLQALV